MQRENRLYDELTPGDTASVQRVCTAHDLYVFAHASGNLNPLNLPAKDGGASPDTVAPSMWVGALISGVLGNVLPGPGTLYRAQALSFDRRVHIGDTLEVTVTVQEKRPDNVVVMETVIRRGDGETVATGAAEIIAPTEKVVMDEREIPDLLLQQHRHFDRIMAMCDGIAPLETAVVAPEDAASLGGALLAAEAGIIRPVLIGAADRIAAVAAEIGADISGIPLEPADSHDAAAARAVEMVHEGRVDALMKGNLHTDALLRHVVKKRGGLRTARRLSHTFVMDVPGLDHLLLVTDAAVNIMPDLECKVDITQNAIDLARALGIAQPKAGILSAVETVNPRIPSTLDAAVLSKMADRGQIEGGLVDGPLAMDNAVDVQAARTKGITSLVAGHADILVVPNLEAGNMLAKELTFIAHAESAGVALGAKVPVILTSRADDDESRLTSCAIAALYQHWKRNGVPASVPEA